MPLSPVILRPPPSSADLVATTLLWFLPAVLASVSIFISPWFLVATSVCESKPSCTADPTVGVWVMVGGGVAGFILGTALSAIAAKQGRWLFPGALLGDGLVLVAWQIGSFLMA